jgi:hypothetical protein
MERRQIGFTSKRISETHKSDLENSKTKQLNIIKTRERTFRIND